AASMDLRAEVVRGLAGAEDALARGRPLGVVLDLRLPDGRGEQFLGRLRTDAEFAYVPVIVVTVEADPATALALGADDYLTIPIVALSASVLPEEIARTKAAGFDLFLPKPISPRDLRDAVRRLGSGSRPANGR